jgi:ATP-binding cassette subfamily B protein/subfamily B ATP-binding cassette protein MsbA
MMNSNVGNPAYGMGRICRWSLGYAWRRWPGLVMVLTAMLLKIVPEVLKPWPVKWLVDYVLNQEPMPPWVARIVAWLPGAGNAEGMIAWCAAATVVLFLLAWSLGLAASLANINFGQRITYDLAADLFRHLQRLSLRFHARAAVGDSVRRVTVDSGCAATIVRDALLPVIMAVINLVVVFTIMWRLDWLLTLVALTVVPGMVMVFRRYAGRMVEVSYRQQEAEGGLYAVIEQTLTAIPVIQAFGREDDTERQFHAQSQTTVSAALSATSVQLQFKILMGLITTVGTAATLWVGATHVLEGRLSVGTVLVFLAYLGSLYGPLEALMYTPATVQGAAGSARRVLELLAKEPEVCDRLNAPLLPPINGEVRLENVVFGYETGRPVLHGVSLDVPAGQTVAVVGCTGAGKTTLVSLVPRFFDPWAGRVTIDGRDLRDVQLQSLREQIGIVSQEPVLFPISIAENIAYARPQATREQIEAAARAANAHGFISRLPHGYETAVGERGSTLSGGERQRLAIARALLKNAPILILDEPTSALDAETESLLLEALQRLMKGRTTLLIAHRLSTVRDADRIIVLDQGRIIESGTHDELLGQGGLYSRFHGAQFEALAVVGTGGGA